MSVRYETSGDVAIITLDRPDVFNSIDQSVSDGLVGAMERAGTETRAAIITGAGKAFCAGADLGELQREYQADGPDLHRVITERFNPIVESLLAAPIPTVAAINGVAAGAGMGVALACDVRILSERAFFMSAFINVGLIPDTGSSWFLPAMVGVSRAMEIAMTGRRVDAEESLRLGLSIRTTEPGRLLTDALEFASGLADGPTVAYPATRHLLHRAAGGALASTLDDEAEVQGELGALPTHLEGMAAFLEKRPPQFRA